MFNGEAGFEAEELEGDSRHLYLWEEFMNIRSSAAIRQNYNEIAEICRKTAKPVFLTKNSEGDLVVMDIETYNRREKMLMKRGNMASSKEYLNFVLEQLSELEEITYRAMMGEYI